MHWNAAESRRATSRALFVGLGLSLLMSCAVVGCGEEEVPDGESLTSRQVLGLEVSHVAAMSASERATLVRTLEAAWPLEPESAEHALSGLDAGEAAATPAALLVQRIRGLDAQREAAALEPLLLGALEPSDTALELPVPREALFEVGQDGLWRLVEPLRPSSGSAAGYDGYLVWDESWGRVERAALGGRTEREALEALEPALRYVLAEVDTALPDAVRVVPAPRAPLLLWYAAEHDALLVNPTLLYLVTDAHAPVGTRRLRGQADGARALTDTRSGDAERLPQDLTAPPAIDGFAQDGGSGGSGVCGDWDPCGDFQTECSNSVEDVLLIMGLVLLGIALIAGVVLLIIFL